MNIAVILSGGVGKRMGSDIPKQYLKIKGTPLLAYSIKAFDDNEQIDQIVIVTSADYRDYVKTEIVDKYRFEKVTDIITGGAERYDSVYAALNAIKCCDYDIVLIHDGARPCVSREVILDCIKDTEEYGSGVAAVPVKDTIKTAKDDQISISTLDRKMLWQVQTPQTFKFANVMEAYSALYEHKEFTGVTDDAMLVEKYTDNRVRLTRADYRNIKVTTPEDMEIAELFLKNVTFFENNC